ncbi:MAG: hypothetical protein GY758_19325, partial [Fuerstiella sp.]|nr:hypothetical protein [Fuerstiella sp.]
MYTLKVVTNDAANSPAPRCSYAHVRVNGNDLGVYCHVESAKKPLLRRNFGTDEGTLLEGTVTDFFADWEKSFERKTGKEEAARSRIRAMIESLVEHD